MAQMAVSLSGSLSALHKGTAEASSLARLIKASTSGINVSVNVAGIKISNDRLSVAESSRFAAELRGLEAARSNIAAGTSLLQVADAGLADITAKLDEMADLAKVAAGTNLSDFDRLQVNEEFQALKADIDVIATDARFNGIDLLQGGAAPGSDLQVDIRVGTGSGAGNTISLVIASAKVADLSAALGAGGVSTLASATAAKTDVAAAQAALETIRAGITGDFARLGAASGNAGSMGAGVDMARADLIGPDAAADIALDTAQLVSDAQDLDLFKGAEQQAQNAILALLSRQTVDTQPVEGVKTNPVATPTPSAPKPAPAPSAVKSAPAPAPEPTAPEPESDG